MENKLENLITKCVLENVYFSGLAGSVTTVQELVHTTSLASLNKMYKRFKKELESLDTDSLFDTTNSTKKNALSLQVDTIREVFDYKKSLIEKEKEKEKRREKRAALLALKTKKEIEEFEGKSIEEIDKELEALSS